MYGYTRCRECLLQRMGGEGRSRGRGGERQVGPRPVSGNGTLFRLRPCRAHIIICLQKRQAIVRQCAYCLLSVRVSLPLDHLHHLPYRITHRKTVRTCSADILVVSWSVSKESPVKLLHEPRSMDQESSINC